MLKRYDAVMQVFLRFLVTRTQNDLTARLGEREFAFPEQGLTVSQACCALHQARSMSHYCLPERMIPLASE